MATVLNMRNVASALGGTFLNADPTAGTSVASGVVATTAGGGNIQWTATSGGTVLEWVSGGAPAGGFTLSGQVTAKANVLESATAANVTVVIDLWKRAVDGTETHIAGGPWSRGTEIGTANTAASWSFTPTSGMAFAEDERLVVRFYVGPATSLTMGGGRTATMRYNWNSANTADTSVTLTETVSFKAPGIVVGVGSAAGTSTVEAQVDSTSAFSLVGSIGSVNSGTVDLSSTGRQAGDLCVFIGYCGSSTTPPANGIPSGFTQIDTQSGTGFGYGIRNTVSYKVLDGTETTITGFNGDQQSECFALVFRGPSGSTWGTPHATFNSSFTGGVSAATVGSSAGSAPLLVVGEVCRFIFSFVNHLQMSPSPDGTFYQNVSAAAGWKFFDSGPSDVTVTPAVSADDTIAGGFYIEAATGGGLTSGAGAAAGSGAAAATGQAAALATAATAGLAGASGTGRSVALSTAASGATGTAAGVGRSVALSTAASAGTGTAAGIGRQTVLATATGSGTSTASGIGQAASTMATAGIATASGIGRSTILATAASTGAGAAGAVPIVAGASAGAATATATGQAASMAASAGATTATAVGRSTASATAASNGTSTAAGTAVMASIAQAIGTGAASGVGRWTAQATAFAAGTATGSANGSWASRAASSGSSAGDAKAQMIGAGAAAGTAGANAGIVLIGRGQAAGTSTGEGSNLQTYDGDAAGTSTVAATGASVFRGTAAASGTATGTANPIIAGSAAGNGAAVATGRAAVVANGSAAGSSAVSGLSTSGSMASAAGSSVASAQILIFGNAQGSSSVDGRAAALAAGVGQAEGSAQLFGFGSATQEAFAFAAGTSTAEAVNPTFVKRISLAAERSLYIDFGIIAPSIVVQIAAQRSMFVTLSATRKSDETLPAQRALQTMLMANG